LEPLLQFKLAVMGPAFGMGYSVVMNLSFFFLQYAEELHIHFYLVLFFGK